MEWARGMAAAIAGLGLAGLMLSGCDALPVNLLSDDTTEHAKITAVRLDDVDGIRLTPSADGASTIHREIHYGGGKPGGTSRVEGGTLVLTGCGPRCSVDYTVQVPRGSAVSGRVSAGAASLTGVGEVELRDSAGDITVTEAAGDVRADSSAGSVRVSKVNGMVTAQSSAGSVEVSDVSGVVTMRSSAGDVLGSALRGNRTSARSSGGKITLDLPVAQDVVADSSAGGIELTVPSGSYRVRAKSSAGGTQLGVPNDPNGTHLLDLRSSAGGIVVRAR